VTLFLEIPTLLLALATYRRRSVRGTVVLVGVLGWLLYYFGACAQLGADRTLGERRKTRSEA
jgi:uncharacterized membrane protein YjjB (DUF3815 family)